MFRLDQYPFVRVETYDDTGTGPEVTAADFYNPTQDHLAVLAGGLFGKARSIAVDEFETATAGNLPFTSGRFGRDFWVPTPTNIKFGAIAPIRAGDHGIWKVASVAGGAWIFACEEAASNLGTGEWIFSCRILITNLARLESLQVGLGRVGNGLSLGFIADTNSAKWQLYDGAATTDSSVTVAQDTWYELAASLVGGTLYWYIDGVEVSSAAFTPGFPSTVGRYVRASGAGGAQAGDGFVIDHFSRGFAR